MTDCDNCGHAAIDHQADRCWIESQETLGVFCACKGFEPEEDDDEDAA